MWLPSICVLIMQSGECWALGTEKEEHALLFDCRCVCHTELGGLVALLRARQRRVVSISSEQVLSSALALGGAATVTQAGVTVVDEMTVHAVVARICVSESCQEK